VCFYPNPNPNPHAQLDCSLERETGCGCDNSWVTALRELRRELLRLGLGPFGNWRQMTSGMHGVLTMLSVCDQVSLYGFTTWPRSMRGGDQYAGNAAKQGSGWMWHDWHGEMHVLRLLHAAGRVSVCSM
jgi:hypothetical protein